MIHPCGCTNKSDVPQSSKVIVLVGLSNFHCPSVIESEPPIHNPSGSGIECIKYKNFGTPAWQTRVRFYIPFCLRLRYCKVSNIFTFENTPMPYLSQNNSLYI